MRSALSGIMTNIVKKYVQSRALSKKATGAIYAALKLRWICQFEKEVPPMDVSLLVERVFEKDDASKEWI